MSKVMNRGAGRATGLGVAKSRTWLTHTHTHTHTHDIKLYLGLLLGGVNIGRSFSPQDSLERNIYIITTNKLSV